MRTPLLSALLPAAIVLALGACGRVASARAGHAPAAPSRDAGGVAFADLDFDGAVSRARTERTLVMVDMYTDWCGWCRKMDRDVFQDDAVGGAARRLVAVRVNAEVGGGEKLADRFEVDGFPTILFVDGSGRLVKRIDGYVGRDEMLEILRGLPRTGI